VQTIKLISTSLSLATSNSKSLIGGDNMIKTKYLNNNTLIQHYSDEGYKLMQLETGMIYPDPIDVVPCRYTYEETAEKIEPDETGDMSEIMEKAKAFDILMGVSE
jgi:hypothetical protein